jgi:hypothetical protein
VPARGEEPIEPCAGLWNGVRSRDSGLIETVRARSLDQRGFDGGRTAQKSRSA